MKSFWTSLIVGCFFFPLSAQTINKSDIEKKIESIFKSYDSDHSPGIAITILQKGKVITRKNYGMTNLEHQVAFTHGTPGRLSYSGSREFMCVGLALIEKAGLLQFDNKVKKYFPRLPSWSDNVTIQDLLNHSSGFDDEWATMLLMQADMNNRVDEEQLLTLLYNQPKPQVEPGKGYMYSNSDFALLRMIMEMVSKETLPDYLKQNLFTPLGMTSTFMNDHLDQIIPGLSEHYFGNGKYLKKVGVKTSPGGNYRIVTTANDLEKWAIALEDTTSMVSKAMNRLYQNARPIPVLAPEVHYIFGHEWQKIGNTTIIRHGGVNHDFYFTRIPSQNLFIIGLGNSFETMDMAMGLADVLLNKKEDQNKIPPIVSSKPINIDIKDLGEYSGRYFQKIRVGHSSHLANIRFYDIKHEKDSLHFYYAANEYFTMIPVGKNLFKDEFGTIIEISKHHPDSTMKMQIWPPNRTVMNFVKVNIKTAYSKQYLEQFTGEYHSGHLDFYCRIILNENNQLILRRPTISDKELMPDGENRFLFEMEAGLDKWYVVAVFTKNKRGEVDGINMQHVRMMLHRFEKVK